jgi:DNA-binding response OmpR family regulator
MEGELGPRVLIADGDTTLRQRLYGALLDRDIFSDCSSSVEDSVEKLDSTVYAVVVLDIALGGELHRVLDRIGAIAHAERPVVLVLAPNVEAARALDVEIVQIVLRKPVLLPQLVDLIRSCIRSATRRALAAVPRDQHAPS